MAKISVCIPSYNHAKYISHTIESVLNQSFTDFEIIISDDNSQDNSIEIIKSFKDKRIKLIENKQNQGPSVNANIAIENASSNFIALIASDDMMHKTRLEKTFNFLTSNPNIDAVLFFLYWKLFIRSNCYVKKRCLKQNWQFESLLITNSRF